MRGNDNLPTEVIWFAAGIWLRVSDSRQLILDGSFWKVPPNMSSSSVGKEVPWPFGTFLLLGACAIIFAMISLGKFTTALEYVVYFEKEMQPIQWLTSIFIHANIVQLVPCLLFLVVFGSLMEERLGGLGTLGLFVGLGAAGQAVVQMALLDVKPGGVSLGAGASVSGWAGLLLICGPLNKVTHISKLPLGKIAVPMWGIIVAWLLIDIGVYIAVLGPLSLLPQVVAFMGGTLLAAAMLKSKLVDGRGEDLLTLVSGTGPNGRKERRKLVLAERAQAERAEQIQLQQSAAQAQLEAYFNAGQYAAALALLNKKTEFSDSLQVNRAQITTIIRGLHKQSKWEESIPWLQQYLEQFPEDVAMRLKLAQIFVVNQRLPGSGMEVLKPLAGLQLAEADAKLYRKLEHAACNMYEDDDIELELEKRSW